MKPTWQESADLKMALKLNPVTPVLRAEAEAFPLEADEAQQEVLAGADCASESWVSEVLSV